MAKKTGDKAVKKYKAHGRQLSDFWLEGEEGRLHPAEHELLKIARLGKLCICGNGTRPATAANENRIRAAFLRFIALGGDDENPLHEKGLMLKGAFIECDEEGLDFHGCSLPADMQIINSTLEGDIIFVGAKAKTIALNGSSVHSIYGDRLKTTGSIFLNHGFTAKGTVRLTSAHIGGDLECSKAQLLHQKVALHADGITTKGDIFLDDGFTAQGTVRLLHAHIGGDLSCGKAQLLHQEVALHADGITTKGTIFLDDGFTAQGTVRLIGAHIGNDLSCRKAQLLHQEKALTADRITTKGTIFLDDGFTAKGTIRLLHAHIGGDLSCRQGRFLHLEKSLNTEKAIIQGNLFLDDGFLAKGTVHLRDTHVQGGLNCINGTFSGPTQALYAPYLTVDGPVHLNHECRIAGKVSFQSATFNSDVTFQGGSFEAKGEAINLRNAKIAGMLTWRGVNYCRGELNLAGASCLSLNMDEKSWQKPAQIQLDNFIFERFAELPEGCNSNYWRHWLLRQPEKHLKQKFRPAPYQQLAKVLDYMGFEEEAKDIRIELREQQRLFAKTYEPKTKGFSIQSMRFLSNLWKWVEKHVVSHGYRPGKALFWLGGLVLIGSAIYYKAAVDGVITPSHPLIYKEAIWQGPLDQMPQGKIPQACRENWVYPPPALADICAASMPSEYSTFNALIYSLDIAVPVVNFKMENDWAPRVVHWQTGQHDWYGWLMRLWEWLQIVLGWILSLLFVSAIGGIIRR